MHKCKIVLIDGNHPIGRVHSMRAPFAEPLHVSLAIFFYSRKPSKPPSFPFRFFNIRHLAPNDSPTATPSANRFIQNKIAPNAIAKYNTLIFISILSQVLSSFRIFLPAPCSCLRHRSAAVGRGYIVLDASTSSHITRARGHAALANVQIGGSS